MSGSGLGGIGPGSSGGAGGGRSSRNCCRKRVLRLGRPSGRYSGVGGRGGYMQIINREHEKKLWTNTYW